MQGRRGVFKGARQDGQTGEVTIGGPERIALSTRIVSLALIGRVAISPLPFPLHYLGRNMKIIYNSDGYLQLGNLQGEAFCVWSVGRLVAFAVVGRVAPGALE